MEFLLVGILTVLFLVVASLRPSEAPQSDSQD